MTVDSTNGVATILQPFSQPSDNLIMAHGIAEYAYLESGAAVLRLTEGGDHARKADYGNREHCKCKEYARGIQSNLPPLPPDRCLYFRSKCELPVPAVKPGSGPDDQNKDSRLA